MISIGSGVIHRQLGASNRELLDRLRAMSVLQQELASGRPASTIADPRARVSTDALDELLRSGADVSDVRTATDLSNCYVFNASGLPGSLESPELTSMREETDVLAAELIRDLVTEHDVTVATSGHFLYPPGGYMGWHTNRRVPGWRVYLTWVDEPGQSFFRYRDTDSGEVVTSWDRGADLRAFLIDPGRPLWHAVYSDTNRSSLGYRVLPSA